jgi:hypothetical protein
MQDFVRWLVDKGILMKGAKIVTSVKQIPRGFVRMAEAVPMEHPKRSTLMSVISAAHRRGTLEAYKLVRTASERKIGATYVHEKGVKALIAAWEQTIASRDRLRVRVAAHAEATTEIAKVVEAVAITNPADGSQLGTAEVVRMLCAIQQNINDLRAEVADVRAATELQIEAVYRH